MLFDTCQAQPKPKVSFCYLVETEGKSAKVV